MSDKHEISNDPLVWLGVLDPSLVFDHVVAAGHRLSDAAKAGDWSAVFSLLDDPALLVDINGWRPGGTAWFTVLHQAAWHGASTEVVAELIRRGALRSLPDCHGRTAHQVLVDRDGKGHNAKSVATRQRKSSALQNLLKPPPSALTTEQLQTLDAHLGEIIDSRIRGVLPDGRDPRQVLRYPPVAILAEAPGHQLWFPVAGMYGGFHITLQQDYLDVKSWCRVIGGSGQAHVITSAGAILVDEGFV